MTVFNLLVSGPINEWPETLTDKKVNGQWIGCDRGTLQLLNLGFSPVVAIGDFDSISYLEYEYVRSHVSDIRKVVPEKDYTDTELAITIAFHDYRATKLNIYGATGGRLDHLLANLLLVLKPQYRKYAHNIKFIDRKNTVSFYLPGEHTIQKEPDKKYLGFVPLGPISDLTLPDEKYQLYHKMVQYPTSYSSNEIKDNVGHFSFTSGILAVIQSKD